jgi:hypothetical protein
VAVAAAQQAGHDPGTSFSQQALERSAAAAEKHLSAAVVGRAFPSCARFHLD